MIVIFEIVAAYAAINMGALLFGAYGFKARWNDDSPKEAYEQFEEIYRDTETYTGSVVSTILFKPANYVFDAVTKVAIRYTEAAHKENDKVDIDKLKEIKGKKPKHK